MHARAGQDDRATAALAAPDRPRAGRRPDPLRPRHRAPRRAPGRPGRGAARRDVRVAGRRRHPGRTGLLGNAIHAAQHGAELIQLGARLAVTDGRARELLHRIEAMRTVVSHTPLVRPPDDDTLAAALTELRRLSALVDDPETSSDRRRAERERLAVERSIRGLDRRTRGEELGRRRERPRRSSPRLWPTCGGSVTAKRWRTPTWTAGCSPWSSIAVGADCTISLRSTRWLPTSTPAVSCSTGSTGPRALRRRRQRRGGRSRGRHRRSARCWCRRAWRGATDRWWSSRPECCTGCRGRRWTCCRDGPCR